MADDLGAGVIDSAAGSAASESGGSGSAGYGSGLIGGILDAAIGPVMANVQFKRSKHVSNRQMKAMQFIAENQPSWAQEGLRRAGLNPILAATRGLAMPASAPKVDAAMAESGGISDALSRGVSSARQLKVLESQARLLEAQARKSEVEADLTKPKIFAEISEILARSGLYDEQMKATATQGPRNIQETELSKAREVSTRLGFPAQQSEAEFYKGLGQEAPLVRFILEILKGARGR